MVDRLHYFESQPYRTEFLLLLLSETFFTHPNSEHFMCIFNRWALQGPLDFNRYSLQRKSKFGAFFLNFTIQWRWCFCNQNSTKWPKMTQNDPKWPKMAQNGPKWPKMTQNDPKWPKMTQNGPKWPKMAQNDPKWHCSPRSWNLTCSKTEVNLSSAWVTRLECPKGVKDEVKQARRAKRVAEGHQLEIGAQRAPRFLVINNILMMN